VANRLEYFSDWGCLLWTTSRVHGYSKKKLKFGSSALEERKVRTHVLYVLKTPDSRPDPNTVLPNSLTVLRKEESKRSNIKTPAFIAQKRRNRNKKYQWFYIVQKLLIV
jgi:hypothetical protein